MDKKLLIASFIAAALASPAPAFGDSIDSFIIKKNTSNLIIY